MKRFTLALFAVALVAVSCVKYEFDDAVPSSDRTQIENGITWTQEYLDAFLGGRARLPLTVRVESEPDGCGATVAHAGGGRLCISTGHQVWHQFPDQHEKITAHEYFHHWQEEHGCVTALPAWLVEGMAEFVGYEVIINAGLTTRGAVHSYHVAGVTSLSMPALEDTESVNRSDVAGIYSLYYLAAERLTDRAGVSAYRFFCDLVTGDSSWEASFRQAFRISPSEFYDDFADYRRDLPE